ncbi:hypothetical protein LPJ72_003494 [Coemansia sp. Benny D160-2]|nr:hypothetical protein LPJ72_003494 [Coemansia sp. Benny D160-2]
MDSDTLGSRIASCVIDQYNALPKTGKPTAKTVPLSLLPTSSTGVSTSVRKQKHEWTVLAGFVIHDTTNSTTTSDKKSQQSQKDETKEAGEFQCVALGTGLKCQHRNQLSRFGDSLHDCHAEVIARRALLVFFIQQLHQLILSQSKDGCNSIFEKVSTGDSNQCFALRPCLRLYLYTSQCPCGSASPNTEPDTDADSGAGAAASALAPAPKRRKTNPNDCSEISGSVQLKPGRADSIPTLSMSCSDKIARWNALGVQGGLLSNILEPVHMAGIVVGDLFNHDLIDHALNQRITASVGAGKRQCEILCTSEPFERSQSEMLKRYEPDDIITADASVYWYAGAKSSVALVNGSKQGAKVVKAKLATACQPPKQRSEICKLSLFAMYCTTLAQYIRSDDLEDTQITYRQAKARASDYQKSKAELLATDDFSGWVKCPPVYESFTADGISIHLNPSE